MKIVDCLNLLLSEELSAISQYVVHAQMGELWGYAKYNLEVMSRAKDEMGHAEKLISRILFLQGVPVVSALAPIHIGEDILGQIGFDLTSEITAIKHYNEGVALAASLADNGTWHLLEANLLDEEVHLVYLEGQQVQVEQMGTANFLSTLI